MWKFVVMSSYGIFENSHVMCSRTAAFLRFEDGGAGPSLRIEEKKRTQERADPVRKDKREKRILVGLPTN